MSQNASPIVPLPDPLTQPFWDGARAGHLMIQRCAACGRWQHPPQALCLGCGSGDLAFRPVSGKGRIHSFTIMRHDHYPSFRNRLPYVNLWVELDEQPFLIVIANLLEAAPEEAAIGRAVEVVFQQISDEITLPQFRLVR